MNTMQIEILNPKVRKLLKGLEDLNLISIQDKTDDGLLKIINKIRSKVKSGPPSLDDITKEVELVRSKRYAKSQSQSRY